MDVGLGIEETRQPALVAKHGCRLRPDLHEADLTDAADCHRIKSALDMGNRVGDGGWQTSTFRFARDQGEVYGATFVKGVRKPIRWSIIGRSGSAAKISTSDIARAGKSDVVSATAAQMACAKRHFFAAKQAPTPPGLAPS
jgi:hypothetical protein